MVEQDELPPDVVLPRDDLAVGGMQSLKNKASYHGELHDAPRNQKMNINEDLLYKMPGSTRPLIDHAWDGNPALLQTQRYRLSSQPWFGSGAAQPYL